MPSGSNQGESVNMVEQVLAGGLFLLDGNSWQSLCRNLLEMGSLEKQSQVCVELGEQLDGQGAPMEVEWANSHH